MKKTLVVVALLGALAVSTAFNLQAANGGKYELLEGGREDGGRSFRSMFGNNKESKSYRSCKNNDQEGICVQSQSKCKSKGGTTNGEGCGSNQGVCCIIKAHCSSNSTSGTVQVLRNMTHLTQPSDYNLPTSQCRFTIPREKNVCQIKLDFKKFSLAETDFDGKCTRDTMIITGADNLGSFALCGEAAGQHLYLHYGSSDTITISFNLFSRDNGNRIVSEYDVLVTKIPCNSDQRAPAGCTQYFRQMSNEVRSFNYPHQQLNDQRYSVCVDTFEGSNRIEWKKCPEPNAQFAISGIPGIVPVTALDCSGGDFLDFLGAGRVCGTEFPENIHSVAKPYVMYVNFNNEEVPSPGEQVNPITKCPIGWKCVNLDTGMELTPAAACTDPGFSCQLPPEFQAYVDVGNVGFCLRYTVV